MVRVLVGEGLLPRPYQRLDVEDLYPEARGKLTAGAHVLVEEELVRVFYPLPAPVESEVDPDCKDDDASGEPHGSEGLAGLSEL